MRLPAFGPRSNQQSERNLDESLTSMFECCSMQTGAWVAPNNPAVAAELYRWCSVLVAASTAFLRQDHTFLDSCADCLSPDQLAWLKSSKQPPVAATQVIAALTLRGGLNPYERAAMMDVLTNFDIALGACERIRSQPIPMAYTR